MDYDKNSFLAGISVGMTMKGWAGGGSQFGHECTTGYKGYFIPIDVKIGLQPSRKYTAIRLPDFDIQWG